MKRRKTWIAVALIVGVGLSTAIAQTTPGPAPAATPTAQADAKAKEMVVAEVRKVDKESGKVTLKHGEIKSLDMPAMTMVFRVKDAALWNTLTEGANVRVVIEKAIVGYTVTWAEAAP
jgi:Cu(I)/Ag(I) efflux system periplasmic protein CusF